VKRAFSRWGAGLIVLGGLLMGLAVGLVIFYGLPAMPAVDGAATAAPSTRGAQTVLPPAPAPVVGAPAPDFSLNDLAGQAVKLSSLRGQVVLVNFWATWCGPCRLEMPTLEKYYEAFKGQGFVVLAVDMGDEKADVQAFASDHKLSFSIVLDPDMAVSDAYRVSSLPTTFIVDAQGRITQEQVGMLTERQLDGYLSAAGLKKP
jgi:peroxiredoxin